MSNSTLATYTRLSPNRTKPRNGTIKAISIHCTAGNRNNTAKQIVSSTRFVTYDAKNGASCHYAVGGDGSIALCVEESNRAWCTSNPIEHHAVTIEVASNLDGTLVNDKAFEALIDLCVDICKRNGIQKLLWDSGASAKTMLQQAGNDYKRLGSTSRVWWAVCNLIPHRYFANKACPGQWLFERYGEIAKRVNARLSGAEEPVTAAVEESADTTEVSPYQVRVNTDRLNVRKGPSTINGVAGVVKKGEVYTIIAEMNGWGQLKSGAGWISLKYVKKV